MPGLLWEVGSKEEVWRGTGMTSKSMAATDMVLGTGKQLLTPL